MGYTHKRAYSPLCSTFGFMATIAIHAELAKGQCKSLLYNSIFVLVRRNGYSTHSSQLQKCNSTGLFEKKLINSSVLKQESKMRSSDYENAMSTEEVCEINRR